MESSPRWSQGTKQLVSAAILVLAGLLVYGFRSILAPVIIAALIAYLLAPLVGWLSRRLRVRRGWVVALIYLIGLGLLATAPAITVSVITNEVEDLWASLAGIANIAIDWLAQPHEFNALGYVLMLPPVQLPEFSLELDKVLDLVNRTISPIAGGAWSIVMTVASGVGWLIFIAIVTFYLLVDAPRVGPVLLSLVPPVYRPEADKLLAQIDKTWGSFLRGQLLLCLVIGTLTGVATGAVGLRFSIALGVVAGILEIVPSLGPILASIPAILLALFQGAANLPTPNFTDAVIVALIYWAIQSLENNFLVPRIIGSSLDLHPLAVIVGVLGGATLGGILGALLAAPTLATLRHILRYMYAKLLDQDPFPEPPSFGDRVRERNVRAILFDLDGTLLNTDNMLVERIARRLRPPRLLRWLYDSQRLARRIVMATESPLNIAVTVLDILGLDRKFFSLGEWLRRAYGQREPSRYEAIDGVTRFVRASSQKYDLAIVTTRNRADTHEFLEQFDLEDCFKAIVTRQDVRRLKPHPEPVVHAARALGVSPQECIVVGDTTVDVRAGKRAGALTVGVLCGFGERPEMERLSPDLILGVTPELEAHLPQPAEQGIEEW